MVQLWQTHPKIGHIPEWIKLYIPKDKFPAPNSLLCSDNLVEAHYPILVHAKTLSKRKRILQDRILFILEEIYRVGLVGRQGRKYAKASCDFIENSLLGWNVRLVLQLEQCSENVSTEIISHAFTTQVQMQVVLLVMLVLARSSTSLQLTTYFMFM